VVFLGVSPTLVSFGYHQSLPQLAWDKRLCFCVVVDLTYVLSHVVRDDNNSFNL
jgi:hypothetical protein